MSSKLRFWIRCPYFDNVKDWIDKNLEFFHDIGYLKNDKTLDMIVTLRDQENIKVLDDLKDKEIKELKNKEWSLLLKFAEIRGDFKYIRSPIDPTKLTLNKEQGNQYSIFLTNEDEKVIEERFKTCKYRSSILNYTYYSLSPKEKYVLIFLSKNIGKNVIFKATAALEKNTDFFKI